MDREGGYKEIIRKFSLHFLILSPFPLRFLFISSFSLHFLAARLQGCNDSCSPGVLYPAVLGWTWIYWAVLGSTGLWWAVLGSTVLWWAVVDCTEVYWAILGGVNSYFSVYSPIIGMVTINQPGDPRASLFLTSVRRQSFAKNNFSLADCSQKCRLVKCLLKMWVWIFSDVFLHLCNLNLPTVSSATFNFSHISAGLIRLHKMTFGDGD